MTSLWIGPLGRIREVRDAATEFDRTISLGVEEFAALGGGVTVSRLAAPPRRLALSWTGMRDDTARWLEALARRVFGPGPLVVLDPASRNLLDGGQSQGYAPRSAVRLAGVGTLAERPDGQLVISGTQDTSQLYYLHSHWTGWPVLPGVPVHFTSLLAPGNAVCRIDFYDKEGAFVESTPTAPVVTAVPPASVSFAAPKVLLKAITGPVPVGPAVLRIGEPITAGEVPPIGDGCPAMAVTSYADKPRLPHRDMALSLVEVRRAGS